MTQVTTPNKKNFPKYFVSVVMIDISFTSYNQGKFIRDSKSTPSK